MKRILATVLVQGSESAEAAEWSTPTRFTAIVLKCNAAHNRSLISGFEKNVECGIHHLKVIDTEKRIAASNTNSFMPLKLAGNSAETYECSNGGKVIAMKKQGLTFEEWLDGFREWLRIQGFMK